MTIEREHIKVTYKQAGGGHLELFHVYRGDTHVGDFFSFRSLPEVLGIPLGTLEGRYARGRLFTVKRDIPTGQSRPVRAFPVGRFDEVVAVIRTPGARMVTELEKVTREYDPRTPSGLPLEVRTVGRNRYITLRGIADHYGKSLTTVRHRLEVAGLLKQAVDVYLNPAVHGGRATKCFPEVLLEKVKRAMEEKGVYFFDEIDSAVAMAGRESPVIAASSGLHPMQEKFLAGDGVTQRMERERVEERTAKVDVAGTMREIEAILAKASPPSGRGVATVQEFVKGQASNPIVVERKQLPPGNLQAWADRLHAAREKIWEFDGVIDEMRKAGLSDEQINEAVTMQYTRPAVSGQERSEGGAA